MEDDKWLAAHHEAGHAVAALRRGGIVNVISLAECYRYCEFQHHGEQDSAFILYAGPWAEARSEWARHKIDGEVLESEGPSFADMLSASFKRNITDWIGYEGAMDGKAESADILLFFSGKPLPTVTPSRSEWEAELEELWTTEISELAASLLANRTVVTIGDQSEPLKLVELQFWQREGLAPGQEGRIRVEFNSS